MAGQIELIVGDDWEIECTLNKDGSAYNINSAATIQAAVFNPRTCSLEGVAVSVLEATAGSDWANGVIRIKWDNTNTDDMLPGTMELRVEVTLSGDIETWRFADAFQLRPEGIKAAA